MNLQQALDAKKKWMKVGDLEGRPRLYHVEGLAEEEVGPEREKKHVLYFTDAGSKPLILNATNSDSLIGFLGPETDDWGGSPVELYPDVTSFAGKRVDCIRARAPQAPKPKAAPAPLRRPTPRAVAPPEDDDAPPPGDEYSTDGIF